MSELGECYICALDSAPLSPCNCRNMYLHYHCQIKLIHEKGEKCSVCLEEFNNVYVFTKVKYCYSWQTKTAFGMIFIELHHLKLKDAKRRSRFFLKPPTSTGSIYLYFYY